VMFGLGSMPAGRLGDLWGRRKMMLVFFFGTGAACILVGMAKSAWQLGVALTVLGAFASIYHPVGIPMLLRGTVRPGVTIGINAFTGNLGIALAALSTGFFVQHFGWRWAFFIPGIVSILGGIAFAMWMPAEREAPARRVRSLAPIPRATFVRAMAAMTAAASAGAIVFQVTTNGNGELLRERMVGVISEPQTIGALLAGIYTAASLTQVVVGYLIDRYSLRTLYVAIAVLEIPLFIMAAFAEGWTYYVLAIGFMLLVFGTIPFVDAIIVRYVDDRMRSRVSGIRMATTVTISAIAIWAIGPVVKAAGFDVLLLAMAVCAAATAGFAALLPRVPRVAS
jgi:MFS family permease